MSSNIVFLNFSIVLMKGKRGERELEVEVEEEREGEERFGYFSVYLLLSL